MSLEPTVLYPLTLPALLSHILSTQSAYSPTTLIICSERPTFLAELAHSLEQHTRLKQWLVPTLHNLSATQHVKLAFCASVQALLAYLTAYDRPGYVHVGESEGKERLVLVDLLALHKPTSSFSAQGLSRTFAAAVEAALRTGATLHLVECEGRHSVSGEVTEDDVAMSGEDEDDSSPAAEQDPWDQDISILNASARRFGFGTGERAWAGRTVKAKRIAARWFRFHNLSSHHTNAESG
ncbi:hypothetical protein E8E11_009520 [Didymella keratinophila]|nr:hypothetical protein E8E11_009520 [Didymella keratinophila]